MSTAILDKSLSSLISDANAVVPDDGTLLFTASPDIASRGKGHQIRAVRKTSRVPNKSDSTSALGNTKQTLLALVGIPYTA